MRTTVKLKDDLLRRARRLALERDATLNDVVEAALRDFLARAEHPSPVPPVKLPRSKQTGGVQPGVDLDDTAGLLDLLSER